MKIAIVVQGRFHAFDLARELTRGGHDVLVLTNYPKAVAERFAIPPSNLRTNVLHGAISRLGHKLDETLRAKIFERFLHRWFSRWAANVLREIPLDVIHAFSGVCEELFRARTTTPRLRTLLRGSAHIEEQFEILATEEKRADCYVDKPSDWIRARELREYELADVIFVLSHYAYRSFVERGVPPAKLRLLALGAQVSLFRPAAEIVTERTRRIRGGEPLRVLAVGSFSLQKGAWDHLKVVQALSNRFRFRFVGTVVPEASSLQKRAADHMEFLPRVAQRDLPGHYAWGDLFLFLSLHDGYAVVLAQASAAGLPLIATTNSAAPDIITEGRNGWVLPIRAPDLVVERLRWCDSNREQLGAMIEQVYQSFAPRDWSDVAEDFVKICGTFSGAKPPSLKVEQC